MKMLIATAALVLGVAAADAAPLAPAVTAAADTGSAVVLAHGRDGGRHGRWEHRGGDRRSWDGRGWHDRGWYGHPRRHHGWYGWGRTRVVERPCSVRVVERTRWGRTVTVYRTCGRRW